MQVHNLIQGSAEWHAFRLNHFGASEASAMLGLSKYMTRNELLKLKATGEVKEVDPFTQKIFDNGHAVEALARPLIEAMIDDELYPVTCSDGDLSASCDGLTMAGDIAFEHKQWNEALASSVRDGVLPSEHVPQCQQILMITGAQKVIFTVSDGSPDNFETMEVFPSEYFFGQIRAGWDQFSKDLASYEHKEAAEKPVADSIESFPVATIQAKGEIVLSNLQDVLPRFDLFLSSQKTELVSDEDFANGEAVAKFSRDTAAKLKLTAKATIDQISSIGDAVRTLESYAGKFDALGLQLEKLVKSEKEARKNAIINAAKVKWREHLDAIDAELKVVRLNIDAPDFLGAVRSKRTIASLENAVDTELAHGKMAADAMAKTYRANLAWIEGAPTNYSFLYANDLNAIAGKSTEDFKNLIHARIAEYETQQAAKQAKEVADQSIKTVQAEQSKPVPTPAKDVSKAVSKEPDLISGFMNSREWPSVAAKNTARAVIVEFLKFQESHLEAA